MRAYYNEIDRYCCDWLSNLMDAGLITPGKIDDRSIVDLSPDDLRGFDRVHFFAGIAGWDCALTLAGWPDDGPVCWTGSCPCQPFSAAGKGKAADDERHLWPAWFSLIRKCKPPIVFGEQVDDAIGWGWLDLVCSQMEAEGYAIGATVLPASGVQAPHIRDRLWFVGHSTGARCDGTEIASKRGQEIKSLSGLGSDICELVHPPSEQAGLSGRSRESRVAVGELGDCIGAGHSRADRSQSARLRDAVERYGGVGELGDSSGAGLSQRECNGGIQRDALEPPEGQATIGAGNPWSNLEWLPCTDGKARPTKPGIFPLAHGVSARMGKLRAAGNAIVPALAAEFIKASFGFD